MLGGAGTVGNAGHAGARSWPARRALSAAACLALAARQAYFWRDGVFAVRAQRDGAGTSRAAGCLGLYANALAEAGRPDDAEAAYEAAWRSNPALNNHDGGRTTELFLAREGAVRKM